MNNNLETKNREMEIANKKTLKAIKEADMIIFGKRKAKAYSSIEELRKELKV